MRARIRICVLTGFLNFVLAATLHAAAGDPDLSFAGIGNTRFGFGFGEDFAYAVAVQPDGKLVVAGSSGRVTFFGGSFSVVRYDTNNVLDISFGEDGKVITSIFANQNVAQAKAVGIQADGKIVLAGSAFNGTNTLFALVRYRPDGSLDNSFGVGGITTTLVGQGASANALAIQPDGKILVAGRGNGEIVLARYTTSGDLDSTFGISGKVVSAFGRAEATSLLLQSSGKIVVAGLVSNNFSVLRYTATGALDTTFGSSPGNGMLSLRWTGSSSATALTIQPGTSQTPQRIVVVGQTRGNSQSSHSDLVLTTMDDNGFQDFGFGFFGTAIVSIGPTANLFGDFPTSVLVQGVGAQSRIIVAGFNSDITSHESFFVARFSRFGLLDTSFDGDGKTFTPFSANEDDRANAMTLMPDGQIVVVGSTVTSPFNTDFALARYNQADGSLDRTFDQGGQKIQDIADQPSTARSVAIQTDGKIVVAGNCQNSVNNSFAVARLNPASEPDPTFGSGGKKVIPFGGANSIANAVVVQPDGKIVAAGSANDDLAVVRLNTNGTLDSSFDADGMVTTPFTTNNNSANAIALQSDGKIVVAGSVYNGATTDFTVVRYRTNGTLDMSFNFSGKVKTAFGTGGAAATAVTIQADGKIVAAGYAVVGGRLDFAAARYNTNGTLDTSFGALGRVTTAIEDQSVGIGMVIQPDGKLLIAGYSYITDVDGAPLRVGICIARYNTNGAPDTTFDGDGVVTTTISGIDVGAAIALQPDGKIVVVGSSQSDDRQEVVAVRYLINGSLDTSYGIGGRAVVDFADGENNSGSALAIDSLGRAVIAGDAGGLSGVARLQADPTLGILSITRLPNQHVVLTGVGVPSSSHTVQVSSNLLSNGFSTFDTVTPDSAGFWQYEDAGATNSLRRFYRLRFP